MGFDARPRADAASLASVIANLELRSFNPTDSSYIHRFTEPCVLLRSKIGSPYSDDRPEHELTLTLNAKGSLLATVALHHELDRRLGPPRED